MRGKIIFGLFALTIVAIFVAMKYGPLTKSETGTARTATAPAVTGESEVAAQAGPAPNNASTEAALDSSAPANFRSDPQFQKWIADEAKSLDSIKVDGDQKEAQMRALVAKLTPSQSRQLRQTVTHPQAKAREKILSVYLLVEGGMNTRADLKEVITAPLTHKGGEAHSEEEHAGVREKSLRIMAVDGLFAQAQKDPTARETLARAIADSVDPYIKAYAQEKYDQLPQR